MRKFLIVAAVLAFSTAPVLAGAPAPAPQDAPHYDIKAHCKKLASQGGYSEDYYNACVDSEQESYNAVKPKWGALTPAKKKQCNKIASLGNDPSYAMLQECVENH